MEYLEDRRVLNATLDAQDDSYAVLLNHELTIDAPGILVNDTIETAAELSVSSLPLNGTLTWNPDGSFQYQPNADFTGQDSFVYTLTAGLDMDLATVNITIYPNTAPVAEDDSFSGTEDEAIAGNVLSNDHDVDGDNLSVTLVDGPSHGSVQLQSDGSFSYAPNADFHGSDSFSYRVHDGSDAGNVAIVSISLQPINDLPVASDDSVHVSEDAQLSGNVLDNDRDADGDMLTVTLISSPSHGALDFQNDGSFVYTPQPNFYGQDSFTYEIGDGTGISQAAVNITVDPVVEPPLAVEDQYSLNEDGMLSIDAAQGPLANDINPDGVPLSASLTAGASHGSVAFNFDGSFSYVPEPNFAGTDSFTYQLAGGTSAMVTIIVDPVNDDPVAETDSFSVDEDAVLSDNVLTNDHDSDNIVLTASLVDGPSHGSLQLQTDGSFTYTPDANFHGSDSFRYRVHDGLADGNMTTVIIDVAPVEDLPTANADDYNTDEDGVLVIDASQGVLVNDSNPDAMPASAILSSGPNRGSLSLSLDGSFSYTPEADFAGTDFFTYQIGDGSSATVTITVNPLDDAPIAEDDRFDVNEDTLLSSNVLANDHDIDDGSLTASLVNGPSHGGLQLQIDGSFVYTPEADFHGTDTFSYRVDGGNVATVSIAVQPINDLPLASADSASMNEDGQLSGNVLDNDRDADADALIVTMVGGPSHGVLDLQGDGSYHYTPDADFYGQDSFTYQIDDGTGSSQATVTITINAVDDSGVAADDNFNSDEDTPLSGNVLENDQDIDGPSPLATLVEGPGHGVLELQNDGSFTYTPAANFHGADSFRYAIQGGSMATVSITIDPVNDVPVADDYAVQMEPDSAASGAVTAQDGDQDSLTFSLASNPQHGSVDFLADGSFTYTPDAGWQGIDSFTYRASDNDASSNEATVFITVTPSNVAPLAQDDSYAVPANTLLVDAAHGVLANDQDPDGDTLSASLATGPSHGTLLVYADGSFSYQADVGYRGVDSFTYWASDSISSTLAFVQLAVTGPTARDGFCSVAEDASLTGDLSVYVSAEPGSNLAYQLLSAPIHGLLTLATDGSYTYQPSADWNGQDRFMYRVVDDAGANAQASVWIRVQPVNDAPVAQDDAASIREDGSLRITSGDLLSNDRDVDGDSLQVQIITPPSHGTLSLNHDGTYRYQPAADFFGSDSFVYRSTDGSSVSNDATVHIQVQEFPLASDDAYAAAEDGSLRVGRGNGLLANDVGRRLRVRLTAGPEHGELILGRRGAFRYRPDANFQGMDEFHYRVRKNGELSGEATVTITVNAVNDLPVAHVPLLTLTNSTVFSAGSGTEIFITDADGQDSVVQMSLTVSWGTLTLGSTEALLAVSGNGTAAVEMTGNLTAINQALDGLSYVRSPLATEPDELLLLVSEAFLDYP